MLGKNDLSFQSGKLDRELTKQALSMACKYMLEDIYKNHNKIRTIRESIWRNTLDKENHIIDYGYIGINSSIEQMETAIEYLKIANNCLQIINSDRDTSQIELV